MKQFVCLLLTLLICWTAPDGYCQKVKIKKSAVKDAAKENKKEEDKESAQAGAFKVGDVAEGLETDGKWYKVDILKVEAGKYFIHWQGFKAQYDRWIEAGKVRALPGGASAAASSSVSASSANSAKTKNYSTEEGGFNVGEYAEGLDRDGKWYEVQIQKDGENELFVVREGYNGFWLKRANLRVKGSTPVSEPIVFKVGDKVHAVNYGKWKPASITNISEAAGQKKYSVSFEDGNKGSVTEEEIRFYNFSGANFKVGEYIRVWYSGNDSLDAAIANVKDGKIMIVYGGYGAKWFAYDAKEVRNDVRAAAVNASKAMQTAFFDECGNYAHSVFAFAQMINPKLVLYNQNRAYPLGTELPGIMKDLDALDAIIKAKYANIQNTEELFPDELSKIPGTWREVCERRKELALKFVEKDVKDQLDHMSGQLNTDYDGIKVYSHHDGATSLTCSSFMWDIIEKDGKVTRPQFQERIKILSENAKIASYNADAQIKKFWELYDGMKAKAVAKIGQIAPAANSSSKYKDAAVEEFGKRTVMNLHPGSVVLRTGVISPDWKIVTNSFGVPKYRSKDAEIAWKLPSGRCVYTVYYYTQDYNGGSYGAGYLWGGDLGAGYQKCQ
ncbi:hypothetical protein JNL27_05830 [bacterium]|nr:hypothetical protein [bacterium]